MEIAIVDLRAWSEGNDFSDSAYLLQPAALLRYLAQRCLTLVFLAKPPSSLQARLTIAVSQLIAVDLPTSVSPVWQVAIIRIAIWLILAITDLQGPAVDREYLGSG